MSEEQKFHKLIQEQESAEKENLWKKIENQDDTAEIDLGEVLVKRHKLPKQNILFICVALLLAVIVSIILMCKFIHPNTKDDFRYCEFGDYYVVDSDDSIKDYGAANNKNILYFDWYEDSEYYADTQYKLKSTDEVIGLCEELYDENGFYIVQYVTDKRTQIDFLNAQQETCKEQTTIKSVEVKYGTLMKNIYAYFSYGDYNYYISLDSTDTDYLFSLLNDLIK